MKADVGQDVTMSCLFDEDKIEQVRTGKKRGGYGFFFVYNKNS